MSRRVVVMVIASICLLAGVASYGGGTGGLLTQTLPYAAKVYDVGDAALGTGLALVRIGVLVALVLGPLADRAGRRRLVLAAAVSHCLLTAVIGLAPTFELYIGGHVALRCIDTLLSVAIGILAVESVPAGNRAVTLSLVFLASGAGVALAVGALPIAWLLVVPAVALWRYVLAPLARGVGWLLRILLVLPLAFLWLRLVMPVARVAGAAVAWAWHAAGYVSRAIGRAGAWRSAPRSIATTARS